MVGGRCNGPPPSRRTGDAAPSLSQRSLADPVPLGKDPRRRRHGLPTDRGPGYVTTPLTDQFKEAQHNINLNGRRRVAIAAHLEVRAVLIASGALASHGLEHVLIGSYPREVAIWPGKDVDVFAKLTRESIDSITPTRAYELFFAVLAEAFADRVTPQARSIKVDYRGGRLPANSFMKQAAEVLRERVDVPGQPFDFSVDVVPAVRWGDVWAIPNSDRARWQRTAAVERWVRTDPERLTTLAQTINDKMRIAGQGAYVPTVKAVRQIRRAHLGDAKPGGLYFELLTYDGFESRSVMGESWSEITASALSWIADRLTTVVTDPLCEPALQQPYSPAPDVDALAHAAATFRTLSDQAARALELDPCPAAAIWRGVFGENSQVNGPVFPLPSGCREDGSIMPATVAANPLRGSNEARGFGRD